LKNLSVTTRLPLPIWYALALVAGSYYAIFYSGSSRLWTFAIAYWILVGAFLGCYSRVQPFDILSPIIGLVVLLFLYSFASGLFVETFGIMSGGEPVSDSVLWVYYLCCLVGLVGLCVGALLGSRVTQTPPQQQYERFLARGLSPDSVFIKRLMFWSVALGLTFGIFVFPQFNLFHVAAYSERALALRVERAGVASAGLREVFFSRLPVTYILCSATLLMLRARHRSARLLGLSLFLAYVLANTLAGWRGAVVAALLIPLVYYHYRIKPFSIRFAIVCGLCIYLFINALSLVRVSSNPSEMVTLLRENVGANGLAFASLSSSGELLVGRNLMRLIVGIQSGETGFTFGSSVVTELLVFVPRSLYAGRPLPLSEKFAQVFYPGVLESGGGYGFFILQDGYWALGIAGVFIFMSAYGWAVQRIYVGFMKRVGNDLALLCYSAVYGAMVMSAVRTGVVSSFKGAIINSVPFIILWVLVKIRLPRVNPRAVGLSDEPINSPSNLA
jgi:oligosaccharide repeat unit polymerase